MHQTELPYHEAAILTRLAGPDETALSVAAAKGILTLGFSPADQDRMHALAAKARAGTLTDDAQAEVEAYSRIGSLLGILKSKPAAPSNAVRATARQDVSDQDIKTKKTVSLSNPHRHKWDRHFRWDGPRLVGRTAIGRATVATLRINLDHRVAHCLN